MPSVKQPFRHEIQTPAQIDMPQDWALLAMCCTEMPAGALSAQIQPFHAINSVRFPVVNLSAFLLQLNINTRATEPYSGFRFSRIRMVIT